TKISDFDFLEPHGKRRPDKAQLMLRSIDLQAKTLLEEHEHRCCGPSLRCTSDRVQGRPLSRPAPEPAEEFRHSHRVEKDAGLEKSGKDPEDSMAEPGSVPGRG